MVTLTEPKLDKNALVVLKKRYLQKDETPRDLFMRVAKHVASAEETDKEKWTNVFYNLMANLEFLPNSPTLFNAGVKDKDDRSGTLSACYVLQVPDTMEGIAHIASTSMMIQKWGGGIGYDFSLLRPKGTKISSTHGSACGPVAVIKHYSSLSDMITQGGKRHGANMAILRIDHPDILEFIHMKDDDKTAQNFNISVAVTDGFIDLLKNKPDSMWLQNKTVKEIWTEIAESAWKTGDPGLWFVDRANKNRPIDSLPIVATNPCGEQGLSSFESCNLGSINVSKFVDYRTSLFNWDAYYKCIEDSVRFLDDVVTVNKHPTKELQDASDGGRRIGLGIMGLADAFVMMKIPYASDKAVDMAGKICEILQLKANESSYNLAIEKGVYPWSVKSKDEYKLRRNSCVTTIAPTGTISRIAGCSSGIEPYFSLAYFSNILDGERLIDCPAPVVGMIRRNLSANDEDYNFDSAVSELAKNPINASKIFTSNEINLLKTSNEIDWRWHVKLQAACQKHIENSISKTINMPESATLDDVLGSYYMAIETGCKGITIYRDKSKGKQVLETGKNESKIVVEPNGRYHRPLVMSGRTIGLDTGAGRMYITINRDDKGDVREVFGIVGHSGGLMHSSLEAIGRLSSWGLKRGGTVKELMDHLRGIQGGPTVFYNGIKIESPPDAIAKALELDDKYHHGILFDDIPPDLPKDNIISDNPCPECESNMVVVSGCDKCFKCGYSSC